MSFYDLKAKLLDGSEAVELKKKTLKSQSQANSSTSVAHAGEAFFESKGTYSENFRYLLENLRENSSNRSGRCNREQKDIIGRVVN